MPRLDEFLLGKTRAASRFDPAQPEGVVKLCGCQQHVISWDHERCPRCEGRPVERLAPPAILANQPSGLSPGTNKTRLETPALAPVPLVKQRNPTVIKDRTVIAPDAGGEVAITIRLKPGCRLESSPTVRLTVGDSVVMLVEGGEVSPHANAWWEVAVGQTAPSRRR